MAHTSDKADRPNMFRLPDDDTAALKWIVDRISKLMSDRKMTADQIIEVKRSARNDGFASDTLSESIKQAKMSPERRKTYMDRKAQSLRLFGYDITTTDEDDVSPPAKLQRAHVQKILMLQNDKKDIGVEIGELYAAAKDRGTDIKTLKQIVKLARMDADDREDWFARVDNMGAKLGYWSMS